MHLPIVRNITIVEVSSVDGALYSLIRLRDSVEIRAS